MKLSHIKITGFLRLNADCQISVTVVWNGNENCLPFTTAFVEFLIPLVDKAPLNGTWGFHLTSSVNAFVTKLMRFFRSFFFFFFFFFLHIYYVTCRVLFVGRLCHSFISQCRHIKQIMDGGSTADAKSRTITRYDFAFVARVVCLIQERDVNINESYVCFALICTTLIYGLNDF